MTRKRVAIWRPCRFMTVAFALVGFLNVGANAYEGEASGPYRTVLIVDQSGSMGALNWLSAFLRATQESGEAETSATPIEYALVLYTNDARPIGFGSRQFGSIEEVAEVLDSIGRGNVGVEDGYEAIHKALATFSRQSSEHLHLLLFTDEDRDRENTQESFDKILADLKANHVTLDVVVNAVFTCEDGRQAVAMTAKQEGFVLEQQELVLCDDVEIHVSNGQTTLPDYIELAHQSGGTAWQIMPFKFDGRLRLRDQLLIGLSEEEVARRLALAPLFGNTIRKLERERRYPPLLVARINMEPVLVAVGEIVTLNGAGSRHVDPGEWVDSWSWDFDDNGIIDAWGDVVATSFYAPGNHVIVLHVADRSGNTAEARVIVQVE
ncbi:MAG: VWA domain-containing protein [Gammaproteobacteria bacterium]|nr:VWA domain-containing protein [Gammaproteobacteria bacterium]